MIGKLSMAKDLDTRIFVKGKVNNYVSEMLNTEKERINNYARLHNVKVNLAQKGDDLMLINSGTATSSLRFSKMEKGSDFLRSIIDNIRINSQLKEGKGMPKDIIA